ncbi:MAG: arginine--tRNA ligase [Nitrospirae bacterium GWC2_57_13]|jgi:arginyl-tRNA synthetase|nr:MAG: arginine--tRNA ligase [Nitrospirae bacterium GWC2_57_13]HAS55522.1 arginine--tRNA ligase [Nitrospiraceae bacterium]
MKQTLTEILLDALSRAKEKGELKLAQQPAVTLETPKTKGHGDLATTLALTLAKPEAQAPRRIAEIIVANIQDRGSVIEKTEIAGPGFINFFLTQDRWKQTLFEIDAEGFQYGLLNLGKGERVLLEYVSANPTGPLHVGHGRGAAVGDALANLLAAVGYDVVREFYINDAGRQIKLLARSIHARYQQALGNEAPFPEDGYHGAYIEEIARGLIRADGEHYVRVPFEQCEARFAAFGREAMLAEIRADLEAFGVRFDHWFSEASLLDGGAVQQSIDELKQRGFAYEHDGALWLKSTAFGDDKDRVVVKQDGTYTYLATDIAYHRNKLGRGFATLVNIWGADHHGYIPRVQAVIQAFGHPKDSLHVLLVQLVTLMRHGQPVPMSKRAGDFVTLRDVMDDVGRDAARYIFLTRRSDSHLDFDLDVAKEQSRENPVYYVQYAHARLSSIFREAETRGIAVPASAEVDLALLDTEEEQNIIKSLARYPEMIEEAALAYEPHRITFYLQDLAGLLHNYYFKHRIIADDRARTMARLFLMKQVKTVIRGALGILGVNAPEKM